MNRNGVKMVINDVFYVPELRENLPSVKKMAASDVNVFFKKLAAEMQHQDKIFAVCPLIGSFYELELITSIAYCEKKRLSADDAFEPEEEETMDNSAIESCDEAEAEYFLEKISSKTRPYQNLEARNKSHNKQRYVNFKKITNIGSGHRLNLKSMSAVDENHDFEGKLVKSSSVIDRYVADKRKTVRLREVSNR